MPASRRSVLRGWGGAMGTGALAGLSGCSGLLGVDGSGDDGANDDGPDDCNGVETEDLSAWYVDWLPVPAELGHDHYGFWYGSIADLVEAAGDTGLTDISRREIVPGLTVDAMDHRVVVGGDTFGGPSFSVWNGDFDPAPVEDEFAQKPDLSEQGTRADYTLWGGPDADTDYAYGVKAGRIVTGHEVAGTPLAAVRTAIDTERGTIDRYTDADEAMASLVGALGSGTSVVVQRHESNEGLGGAIGAGSTLTIGDTSSTVTASAAFPSPQAVSTDPVAEWAAGTWAFGAADDLDVGTDCRVATIETAMDTSAIEYMTIDLDADENTDEEETSTPVPDTPDVPTVDFHFDYDDGPGGPDEGILTVTHSGGDYVVRDRVSIRGSGFADVDGVDQTETGPWQGRATDELDGHPSISAGDQVTVGVESDYWTEAVWTSGERRDVLGADTGPDR